jgi:hypothetical protein
MFLRNLDRKKASDLVTWFCSDFGPAAYLRGVSPEMLADRNLAAQQFLRDDQGRLLNRQGKPLKTICSREKILINGKRYPKGIRGEEPVPLVMGKSNPDEEDEASALRAQILDGAEVCRAIVKLLRQPAGAPDPPDNYADYRDGPGGPLLTSKYCKERFNVSGKDLSTNKKAKETRRRNPSGRDGGDYVYRYDVISLIANRKAGDE